jgi:hypothetical protein
METRPSRASKCDNLSENESGEGEVPVSEPAIDLDILECFEDEGPSGDDRIHATIATDDKDPKEPRRPVFPPTRS